jgi:hypothetical protein
MTSPLVRFLVGGVQKGGTTALARYLAAHPALALPVNKEAHVFDAPAFDDAWDVAAIDQRYRAHLPADAEARLCGDATPIYLFHPRLVARIARYNPAMRWIVLLRHPVERALSQYHMERARGLERWPLWPALLLERWRLRGHADDLGDRSPLRTWSYRARGDYARQLDVLYGHFPRDQVLVLRSDELLADPAEAVARACDFLGVPPLPGPVDFERVFEGAYRRVDRRSPTFRVLRWLLRRELADMRERYGLAFD